jgi:hypothetical protein
MVGVAGEDEKKRWERCMGLEVHEEGGGIDRVSDESNKLYDKNVQEAVGMNRDLGRFVRPVGAIRVCSNMKA